MSGVIKSTSPILGPIYSILGVEGEGNQASKASDLLANAVNAGKDVKGPGVPAGKYISYTVVTSNPSGAEIYINDKRTGFLTPSQVPLPEGKFKLSFRRQGYDNFNMAEADASSIGNRVQVQLVKSKSAYVDIEVIPIQDVKIEVNGKVLESVGLPLRRYPIPAGQNIRFKVTGPNDSKEAEVVLGQNQRKVLTFRLNPPTTRRTPSNK